MLVIVAPGQGAQTPGFLAPWLEIPGVADRLAALSELAGCDLIRYGTTASADEITDTAIAQPLLVAAGLAAAQAAFGELADAAGRAHATAGHSVGELTAGAIAGLLSAGDALRLVQVRGKAMAAAAAMAPTGMTAVLGGDEKEVLASIEAHGLTPANVNGAGQIVAAGTLSELAAFAGDPPPKARLKPLRVAGAFHTRHMAPAVDALRDAAVGITVGDPAITVLSNIDGAPVRSGGDWLARIVKQVSAPVRWDECMRSMASLGVTALIELPPAGTLTGLARRALPGVALLGLKTPDQLDAARVLAAEHGRVPLAGETPYGASLAGETPYGASLAGETPYGASLAGETPYGSTADPDGADALDSYHPGADSHSPDWRLLVAPTAGTFRAGQPVALGAVVGTGAELGLVEARADRKPITAPCPGAIVEWLVEDGDPVNAGQPLLRLQPQASEQKAV